MKLSSLISAVLVDLHHPNPAANEVEGDLEGDGGDACGPVNVDAVQQVIAAKWAVDVINNQSLPHELKIGKNVIHRLREFVRSRDHATSGQTYSLSLDDLLSHDEARSELDRQTTPGWVQCSASRAPGMRREERRSRRESCSDKVRKREAEGEMRRRVHFALPKITHHQPLAAVVAI